VLELAFTPGAGAAVVHAASPQIELGLRIAVTPAERAVRTITLNTQVQIECAARSYTPFEQERLSELFGEAGLWQASLRSALWTRATTHVPAFQGQTEVSIALPCGYDLEVVATKYFFGLQDGTVPLRLSFSGTVFHGELERLQVSPIAWSHELAIELPVQLWRQAMALHYPDRMLLGLRRDVFERLYRYRRQQGLATWERTISHLLEIASSGTEAS
jgi:hypothetical protein